MKKIQKIDPKAAQSVCSFACPCLGPCGEPCSTEAFRYSHSVTEVPGLQTINYN